MKVKEKSEKVGLKLNITSFAISSWQTDGEIVETVADSIFLGSKITVDGDFSPEIKRCLLLGRKVMTNLKVKVKLLSCVQLFATPQTIAYQAPLSWDFPGMNTGVGCHFLLQGIFLTQGLNPGLPHCRQMLYHLSHQGT